MGLVEVIVIGMVAGLATTIGGFVATILPVENEKCLKFLLGFAGGVMVGLSLFQLMPEGYFFSNSLFAVSFGFIVGLLLMALLSQLTGNACQKEKCTRVDFRKTGLFICLALALHNFPEGIAVGVGFSSGNDLGFMIAFAMMLHNIPEGVGIGAPLKKGNMSAAKILLLTTAAGFVTPLGASLGWWLGHISMELLSWGMGLAAGAMVYVSFTKLFVYGERWNEFGIFCGILLTFIIA
jgi:ZIP family zinc transporter